MKEKTFGKIRTAVIAGFAAAVVAGASGAQSGISRQTFLFPQFASAAAAERAERSEKTDGENQPEFVYTFKIAELIERWFS